MRRNILTALTMCVGLGLLVLTYGSSVRARMPHIFTKDPVGEIKGRRLIFSLLLVLGLGAPAASAERRAYEIALGFPFPPWDVGPREGVNYDLLTAICAANASMRCKIVDRPYSDCIGSDAEGRPIIGPALASGRVDGCMGWLITPEREQLGAEFTHAYSFGPTPQLIASNANHGFDGLGASGAIEEAKVGFLSGFFNNPTCLAGHYSGFSSIIFAGTQAGRDAMIAALFSSSLDLAFWDSINTVPTGTHVVGEPVQDCGPHLALIVFPPRLRHPCKSDELRRDFNCGLALIRANGVMANLCANSSHPGGDPTCILEGPPPTVQCLADNLTETPRGQSH